MKLGTLCYIRQNDSTLLLYRNKKINDSMHGFWIGLGGHIEVDRGESPHECVIREVQEESGLSIKPKLRGIITFKNVEPEVEDWYAYVFTAEDYTGEIKECSEGKLEWIPDKKLP